MRNEATSLCQNFRWPCRLVYSVCRPSFRLNYVQNIYSFIQRWNQFKTGENSCRLCIWMTNSILLYTSALSYEYAGFNFTEFGYQFLSPREMNLHSNPTRQAKYPVSKQVLTNSTLEFEADKNILLSTEILFKKSK